MIVGDHDPEPPHPEEAQTRPNTAQMALATDIHVLMLVKPKHHGLLPSHRHSTRYT